MRRVHQMANRFAVDDDPKGIIGTLLSYAASDDEVTAAQFEPDGDGYTLDDLVDAYRVEDPEDIPTNLRESCPRVGEVWIVSVTERGVGTHSAWVEGEELRVLLSEAQRLHRSRT